MIPRTISHTFQYITIAIACFCALLADVSPGITALPSKNPAQEPAQVRRIETELSKEKKKYLVFHTREKELLARLSVLEKKVAERRVQLAAIQQEIKHSASVIRSLQTEKGKFESALREVEKKLMKRLVALYKYSKRGYMKILATATGLDEFRLRLKYLKSIMQEDRRALEVLVGKKEEQEERIAALRRQLTITRSARDRAKRRLASLKNDLEDKVILLMKTHKEKEFYQTAIRELEEGAENLKNTLLDLEKRPSTYTGKRGSSTFVKEKGQLPLPLEGRVLQGKDVLGASAARIRRGIYIESKGGDEVRCVFPGTVAFSGRVKGYGETVIVNHGSRFFTVFAELKSRMKNNGDRVQIGDVIGFAGNPDVAGLKRVYFEIRHGEAVLNTAKWLKTK